MRSSIIVTIASHTDSLVVLFHAKLVVYKAILPLLIIVFMAVHYFLDLGKCAHKGSPVHVLFLLHVMLSHCGQQATKNVSL